ncbi:hypothetical protein CUMW_084560, partial [Citrus unshiu]
HFGPFSTFLEEWCPIFNRTIEGLRICFDAVSDDDIANWINFATERRFQKLELDFTEVQFDITGETVENLLSNCPFLEVLSVDDSNCFKSLKVSGPSLKLRRLELKYLSSDFMDLEIDVGNIISFEFFAYDNTVSFVNVPSFAELFKVEASSGFVRTVKDHPYPIDLCRRETEEYQPIRKRAIEFAANYPQLDFVIP